MQTIKDALLARFQEPEVIESGGHTLVKLRTRPGEGSGKLADNPPEETLGFFWQMSRDMLEEHGRFPPTIYLYDGLADSDMIWTDMAETMPDTEQVARRAADFLEENPNISRLCCVFREPKAGARGAASYARRREVLIGRIVDRGRAPITKVAEVIRDADGNVERIVDNPQGIYLEIHERRLKALL
jgi:hypothetical protein